MKTPEEIEGLAKEYAETFRFKTQKTGWYFDKVEDYTKGYTECQQYMADEIRRWRTAVDAQEKRCKALRDAAEELKAENNKLIQTLEYASDGLTDAMENIQKLKKSLNKQDA